MLEEQEYRAECVMRLALRQLTVWFMYTHKSPMVLGTRLMDVQGTSWC